MKQKIKSNKMVKVKSKFNDDTYYTNSELPTKVIDGVTFIGVKKDEKDARIFFLNKDNIEFC